MNEPRTTVSSLVMRRFLSLLPAILLMLAAMPLRAQPGGPPGDTIFHLVGTNITDVDIARDSLLLDLVRFYHTGSPEEMLRLIAEPRDAFEQRASQFYRRALETDFRIIAPVPGWAIDLNRIRVFESYARADGDRLDNLPFYDINGGAPFDTALHGLALGVTVRAGAGDVQVAGRPSYLAQNIFHRGDERIYRRLGIPDRSTWFRLGVTIAVDTADPAFGRLDDQALLGYIHLYRRVRSAQEECRCNIYENYDSLPLTKGLYLGAEDAGGGYRDVGWTLDFVRDTVVMAVDTVTISRSEGARYLMIVKNHPGGADIETILDTLPGRRIGGRADTVERRIVLGEESIVELRLDSIQRYHVMLAEPRDNAWEYGAPGSWFGYAPGGCERFCDSLIRSGRFGPKAVREYVEGGDFDMKFFSTGRAPFRFLQTRINQELYDRLRRGELDTLIRSALAPFLRSDTLRRLIAMVAFDDEVTHHKYRSHGELARRLGRIMREMGVSEPTVWQNPQGNFDGFRAITGDLDHPGEGTVRLIVRQDYSQIGALDDPLPIFYANPDSMSWWGTHRIYSTDTVIRRGAKEERVRWSLIAPNSAAAHRAYNERRQRRFGSFLDAAGPAAVKQGGLVTTLARAVDVAKFRYLARGAAPVPVWNSIQDMGWQTEDYPHREEPGGAYNPWGLRPPTPEEITAQAWLSLNCGVDGLVYTDAQYDGINFGFVHALDGSHDAEYAPLLPANTAGLTTPLDTLVWRQPRIWAGFRSRFDAVRRVNRELRLLDSLVGLRQLRFNREQVSAHDPRQSFREIPLLDSLYTIEPRRFTGLAEKRYSDSTIDPRGETWLEISHFLPSPRDTARGAHYYLLTNRRCWPVDDLGYGAAAAAFGSGGNGLGAVDVRRPVIVLGGEGVRPGTRFLVEKVGHERAWPSKVGTSGERIALDWLEPGWGAMYRITPMPPSQ